MDYAEALVMLRADWLVHEIQMASGPEKDWTAGEGGHARIKKVQVQGGVESLGELLCSI